MKYKADAISAHNQANEAFVVPEQIILNDYFKFTGKSQITSHTGEILSSAPNDKIFIDFVDIDITKARDKRLNDFNDIIGDRRPKFYFNNIK